MATASDVLEIVFRPDSNVYDGRYANVGWLQEIPRPVTNLSWDNAALFSYATMEKLGFAENDAIEITLAAKRSSLPRLLSWTGRWRDRGHAWAGTPQGWPRRRWRWIRCLPDSLLGCTALPGGRAGSQTGDIMTLL